MFYKTGIVLATRGLDLGRDRAWSDKIQRSFLVKSVQKLNNQSIAQTAVSEQAWDWEPVRMCNFQFHLPSEGYSIWNSSELSRTLFAEIWSQDRKLWSFHCVLFLVCRRRFTHGVISCHNLLAKYVRIYLLFTAQCTLVHMRGLGIACRLSVCDVGDLWSHKLEILDTNCTHNWPYTFALCNQEAIHLLQGEHGEILGRLEVG